MKWGVGQLWQGGIVYSAADGPRGDHLQCHGWSGGTDFGGDHL